MKYAYYEERNCVKVFTEPKLYRFFSHDKHMEAQRKQGTTYGSWLSEMVRHQILVPLEG